MALPKNPPGHFTKWLIPEAMLQAGYTDQDRTESEQYGLAQRYMLRLTPAEQKAKFERYHKEMAEKIAKLEEEYIEMGLFIKDFSKLQTGKQAPPKKKTGLMTMRTIDD